MSAAASFSSTINVKGATISATADGTFASATPTGGTSTLQTGGASGTQVYTMVFQGYGTSLAGIINVWLYDGTNYYLIDQVKFLGVAGSTTANSERFVRSYESLLIPATTWSLRVSSAVASQKVVVTAFGGDL